MKDNLLNSTEKTVTGFALAIEKLNNAIDAVNTDLNNTQTMVHNFYDGPLSSPNEQEAAKVDYTTTDYFSELYRIIAKVEELSRKVTNINLRLMEVA